MRLRRVRQRVRAFIDLAGDVKEIGSCPGKWARIGLTYRPGEYWHALDIAFYLTKLRNWADRKGFKLVYLWVAELQERGAVHYHVMVKLPKGFTIPKPDKSGMWSHGSSCVEWVHLSGKHYMSKYAQKEEQKRGVFPLGLRLCGAGGLGPDARAWWTWLLSPRYVREETEPNDLPRRVAGGWRCSDGYFIPTPWAATFAGSGVVLRRKSVEERWNCALDSDPVNTYLRRESFKGLIAGMWKRREKANDVRYVSPWIPFDSVPVFPAHPFPPPDYVCNLRPPAVNNSEQVI